MKDENTRKIFIVVYHTKGMNKNGYNFNSERIGQKITRNTRV